MFLAINLSNNQSRKNSEGQNKRRKDPCFLLWAKEREREREAFDDAADWNVTVVVVESRKRDIIRLILVQNGMGSGHAFVHRLALQDWVLKSSWFEFISCLWPLCRYRWAENVLIIGPFALLSLTWGHFPVLYWIEPIIYPYFDYAHEMFKLSFCLCRYSTYHITQNRYVLGQE